MSITVSYLTYSGGTVSFHTPGWNFTDITFDVPAPPAGSVNMGGLLTFENIRMVIPPGLGRGVPRPTPYYRMVPVAAWHVEAEPSFALTTRDTNPPVVSAGPPVYYGNAAYRLGDPFDATFFLNTDTSGANPLIYQDNSLPYVGSVMIPPFGEMTGSPSAGYIYYHQNGNQGTFTAGTYTGAASSSGLSAYSSSGATYSSCFIAATGSGAPGWDVRAVGSTIRNGPGLEIENSGFISITPGYNRSDPFDTITIGGTDYYLRGSYHGYPSQAPLRQALSATAGGRVTFRLAAYVDTSGATLDLLDIRFSWFVNSTLPTPSGWTTAPPITTVSPVTGDGAFIAIAHMEGYPDTSLLLAPSGSLSGAMLAGDLFQAGYVLSLAWIDGAGALNTSAHFSPIPGQGAVGWQTPVVLETSGVSAVGLAALTSGKVTLRYAASTGNKRRENLAMGSGPSANWSASAATTEAPTLSAVGRDTQQSAFDFSADAGALVFARCVDESPANAPVWSAGAAVVSSGVRGPNCGGDWTGSGWGGLWTRDSDGAVFWSYSSDGATWAAPVALAGIAGEACGLRCLPSGELCGLLWDSGAGSGATGKFWMCRSPDGGLTWTKDAAAIPTTVLPAMPSHPPVLLKNGGILVIAWISSGSPVFVSSADGGRNWA